MGSKYKAIRTNGYASKREAAKAAELTALANSGKIRDLQFQVPFELVPKNKQGRAIKYVADFTWWENDQRIVADAKGFPTPVYKLKKRLMFDKYGIEIQEL